MRFEEIVYKRNRAYEIVKWIDEDTKIEVSDIFTTITECKIDAIKNGFKGQVCELKVWSVSGIHLYELIDNYEITIPNKVTKGKRYKKIMRDNEKERTQGLLEDIKRKILGG